MAKQLVLVNDSAAIIVLNGQIQFVVVRDEFECGCIDSPSGNERKAAGLITEACAAIIAKQDRLITQQKQVEVVIVVKIYPDSFPEMTFRQLCREAFKSALTV